MARTRRKKAEPAREPRRSTCPTCGKPVDSRDLAADEDYPFCCRRCRLVDLGRWFDGEHRISTPIETEEE